MVTTCSICGNKMDALFPLVAKHPQYKICSTCSIQKSYLADAANQNDAASFKAAAAGFMARTCSATTDEVKADMESIIQSFEAMLLSEEQDVEDFVHLPTTTSDRFEGLVIKKYCGTVSAYAAVLISAIEPGHESSPHIARLNNRKQMLIQAKGLGGNALINCDVKYIPLNDKYLLIASTGDAVVVE